MILGITLPFVIPRISNWTSTWGTNEVLVFVTSLGILITIIIPFISRKMNKTDPTFIVSLNVQVLPERYCIFSVSIENVGKETIKLLRSNVLIDEGVKTLFGNEVVGNESFENEKKRNNDKNNKKEQMISNFYFPLLTRYSQGKDDEGHDCELSKALYDKKLAYPDDEMKTNAGKLIHTNYEVERFSEKSIRNIKPKEKYTDDIVFKFSKDGVYRGLFIVVTENARCSCSSKQFVVKDKSGRQTLS
jgi:hypothetical protein